MKDSSIENITFHKYQLNISESPTAIGIVGDRDRVCDLYVSVADALHGKNCLIDANFLPVVLFGGIKSYQEKV